MELIEFSFVLCQSAFRTTFPITKLEVLQYGFTSNFNVALGDINFLSPSFLKILQNRQYFDTQSFKHVRFVIHGRKQYKN